MFNLSFTPEQLAGLVKDAEGGGGYYFVSPDEEAVQAGQSRAWWEQVEITAVEVVEDPKGDDFPNNQRVKVEVSFRVADEGVALDHRMGEIGPSENSGASQTDRFWLVPVSEKDNLNTMTDISAGKLGQLAFAALGLSHEDPESIPKDDEGGVDVLSLVQQAQGNFVWARFRRKKEEYVDRESGETKETFRTEFTQAMPVEVEG